MRTAWIALFVLFFTAAAALAADVPTEIAGFELGRPVGDVKDRILPDTVIPTRYLESFKEVETRNMPGFKSGLVGYGTCDGKNRIIRLKFKYAESSKAFFDTLLKKYTRRFGKPDVWRGDSFHTFIAWKWSFTDERGHDISMILQHNTEEESERIGNSVKLTDHTLLDQEMRCFWKKTGERPEPEPRPETHDWDMLIPR